MLRRTCILLAAVVALACGAGAATAWATLPTQQFQTTYGAWNPWVAWETWLPQPQCTEKQVVYGSEPAVSGTYPVLIYLHSTFADLSGNAEGQVITQLAAAQGFVALAPTYDSTLTNNTVAQSVSHATCIFSSARPGNVVTYACSLPEADCSHGVAVAGFSQGAGIAMLAANANPLVQAAWAIGVNGSPVSQRLATPVGTRALPNSRLRLDIGQLDVTGGGGGPLNLSNLQALTGDNCGTAYNCRQVDGSGYYVVANSQVADGSADHCYWMSVHKFTYSCTMTPTIAGLDPGFAPPSTTPWSLISALNWVRGLL